MGIFIKIGILHTLKFHLHTPSSHFWLNLCTVLKQFIIYAPGVHCLSRGTYEHGDRSCPTESLAGAMFSGVLAVFCSHCLGFVSFVWLLGSDPVARIFLTHLKMSSFDGKFFKLYFAWISPAPFCTIFTQNIKWHKNFLFVVIFNSFKDPKLLWSHLFK